MKDDAQWQMKLIMNG